MNDENTIANNVFEHQGDEPHLLREVIKTYRVMMGMFSRATGMPASRFLLMRVVAHTEDGIGISDLARAVDVDLAAVSRQVKELVREGLLVRRGDPKDGRRSYVALSPEGEASFKALHGQTHELEGMLVEALGAEDMAHAAAVLQRLRGFLEGLS